MLIGTLLFSVPLIIHLLNRRRYRVKPWAAMDFLLAAYKRTRRRLRMENFLLLLLRCLIIILLAMAMAKPFVSSDSAVAGLASIRRDVVVVLDNSYSMGYRLTPDETCFDLARKKISALLARLDSDRGDTVTMILMGEKPEFAVPYLSPPQEALIRLDRLREPASRGAEFSALADLLANEVAQTIEGPKEVYVFSDLQARTLGLGFSGDPKSPGNRGQPGEKESTAALLARAVDQDTTIRFIDVGKPDPCPPNMAVMDMSILEPYVTTGMPATFIATVQNFSDVEVAEGRGAFLLDGKPVGSRSFRIAPNATTSLELTYTVHEPGYHHIAFKLEEDRLPLDDQRWYAFDARQSVRVLLVEGRPNEEVFENATGELMRVINPVFMDGDFDEGTVFKPEVVDFKLFNTGAKDVNDYDCVMIADVEGLSTEMTNALGNYVQTGGALVLFMGENVDLPAWNLRLFPAEGTRLLPGRLEEFMGEEEGKDSVDYFRLSVSDSRHPIFEVFSDPRYSVLLEVPVFRFVRMSELNEDALVVARLTDVLDRTYPAVVENRVGAGKVVWFAISTSPEWSLIPERPVIFLPVIHSLLYHLTARDNGRYNLKIGTLIDKKIIEFPDRIALIDPSGYREEINEAIDSQVFGKYVLPLKNHPLDIPGPYSLEVDITLSGRNVRECYVANIDPFEGNLRRFDTDGLAGFFPAVELSVLDSAVLEQQEFDDSIGKGEFWQVLLMALLAMVALELFLSWKFGNYR